MRKTVSRTGTSPAMQSGGEIRTRTMDSFCGTAVWLVLLLLLRCSEPQEEHSRTQVSPTANHSSHVVPFSSPQPTTSRAPPSHSPPPPPHPSTSGGTSPSGQPHSMSPTTLLGISSHETSRLVTSMSQSTRTDSVWMYTSTALLSPGTPAGTSAIYEPRDTAVVASTTLNATAASTSSAGESTRAHSRSLVATTMESVSPTLRSSPVSQSGSQSSVFHSTVLTSSSGNSTQSHSQSMAATAATESLRHIPGTQSDSRFPVSHSSTTTIQPSHHSMSPNGTGVLPKPASHKEPNYELVLYIVPPLLAVVALVLVVFCVLCVRRLRRKRRLRQRFLPLYELGEDSESETDDEEEEEEEEDRDDKMASFTIHHSGRHYKKDAPPPRPILAFHDPS